jgi:hypothetical protein
MYGLFLTADRWRLLVLDLRVGFRSLKGGLHVTVLAFGPVDVLAVGILA